MDGRTCPLTVLSVSYLALYYTDMVYGILVVHGHAYQAHTKLLIYMHWLSRYLLSWYRDTARAMQTTLHTVPRYQCVAKHLTILARSRVIITGASAGILWLHPAHIHCKYLLEYYTQLCVRRAVILLVVLVTTQENASEFYSY